MRAETAAAYCDEISIQAFKRRVGSVYPYLINVSGRGRVWLKDDLDIAIDRLAGKPLDNIVDAADFL